MNFVFFLSFTEGEKWICHPFSDIRKRCCNVEFFSLSPFRKINGERGFMCRDFAPVAIYGNWPDELKLRSSDATWSVWPWITNPNPDPSKGTHLKIIATNRLYHQRLCLEAWHTNPAHALLNRDDGGYFLTPIYTSSEKRQLISERIKGPLAAAFRSPLNKAIDRSVETLGLWIVTSSVTFIKSVNQSSIKPCLIVHLVAMWTLIYFNVMFVFAVIFFSDFRRFTAIQKFSTRSLF